MEQEERVEGHVGAVGVWGKRREGHGGFGEREESVEVHMGGARVWGSKEEQGGEGHNGDGCLRGERRRSCGGPKAPPAV